MGRNGDGGGRRKGRRGRVPSLSVLFPPSSSASRSLLMHRKPVDMHVEIVIHPQADDARQVGWLGGGAVDFRAVDQIAHLARLALGIDFQLVGAGLVGRVDLVDRGAGGPVLDDVGAVAGAALDQVLPVLPDQEVGVLLVRPGEVLAVVEEAVGFRMCGRLGLDERRQRVERAVGHVALPVDDHGRAEGHMEPAAHGDELDVAHRGVAIGAGRPAVGQRAAALDRLVLVLHVHARHTLVHVLVGRVLLSGGRSGEQRQRGQRKQCAHYTCQCEMVTGWSCGRPALPCNLSGVGELPRPQSSRPNRQERNHVLDRCHLRVRRRWADPLCADVHYAGPGWPHQLDDHPDGRPGDRWRDRSVGAPAAGPRGLTGATSPGPPPLRLPA